MAYRKPVNKGSSERRYKYNSNKMNTVNSKRSNLRGGYRL